MGTFFAAHAAAAGRDVVACARRPFTRYVVESPEAPTEAPANVLTDPADWSGAAADLVLVTTKANQTDGAAGWLKAVAGPDTAVVVVQNGIEGEARVRPFVGDAAVLAAVVYCGSELVEPGRIRHMARGQLIVSAGSPAQRLADAFAATPVDITVLDEAGYLTEAWRKLGLNVVLNGLTALTGRTMEVLRRPDVAEIAAALLTECWTVARAEGAALPQSAADRFIEGLPNMPRDGATSMLHDRRAGRPTEHDALYGGVMRAAARHGIATPTHRLLAALIAAGDPV